MDAKTLDRLIESSPGIRSLRMPPGGWLKTARIAIGFTQADMAEYLQVRRATVEGYERNEARGKLTMERLQTYAAALGCEVVHVLVPKSEVYGSFSSAAESVARYFNQQTTAAAPPPPASPPSPGLGGAWKGKALKAFFSATEDPTNPGPSPEELARQAMSFGKKPPQP